MKVTPTALDGVLLVEPNAFGDQRGYFMESWKSSTYSAEDLPARMVQSNFSRSTRGVLRGMHYQHPQAQGKLVSVLEGSIFDVAVDIRRGSPGFGKWFGIELNTDNRLQLYIPEGFAHGFCVLSETALVHYMCTSEYAPEYDAALAWNDPDIGIEWPVEPVSVSAKDTEASALRDIPETNLPGYP